MIDYSVKAKQETKHSKLGKKSSYLHHTPTHFNNEIKKQVFTETKVVD